MGCGASVAVAPGDHCSDAVIGHARRALAAAEGGTDPKSELRALIKLLETSEGGTAPVRMTFEALRDEVDMSADSKDQMDDWLRMTLGVVTPRSSTSSADLCSAAAAGNITRLRMLA